MPRWALDAEGTGEDSGSAARAILDVVLRLAPPGHETGTPRGRLPQLPERRPRE